MSGEIHDLARVRAAVAEGRMVVTMTRHECQHARVVVDEREILAECEDCKAKLNPIALLLKFTREAGQWRAQREALTNAMAIAEKKLRLKCPCCNRMLRLCHKGGTVVARSMRDDLREGSPPVPSAE